MIATEYDTYQLPPARLTPCGQIPDISRLTPELSNTHQLPPLWSDTRQLPPNPPAVRYPPAPT